MSGLPSEWVTRRLGDLALITMGQSPPGSTYNKSGNGTPFFQGKSEFGAKHPTVRQWTTGGTKFAEPGDVLMSVRAPVGPTNIADTFCSIGRGLASIRSGESLDQQYLIWYLKYMEAAIQARGKGTTFDAISGDDLRDTLVNIPGLKEQRRIVAVLDGHLSRLDKALAEMGKVWEQFEALERSARVANFDLASSFKNSRIVHISDVTEKVKSVDPKSLGVDSFKYVDISSISPDVESPQITQSTSTSAAPSRARQHLKSGDIVFSTVRPYQKKIALVKDDLDGQIASTGFCVLRPLPGVIDSRYLFHYLKSDMLLDQVLPLQRGASYPAVGDSDVKQSTIPLPDFESQRSIADELDAVVGTVKALKDQMKSNTNNAQVLRRSLLHKAFSGELLEEK